MQWLKKIFLKTLAFLLGNKVATWLAKIFTRKFVDQWRGEATNDIFIAVLKAMDVYACLFKKYRANLNGWVGDLVFTTRDGAVAATARMCDGDMKVLEEAVPDPAVAVEFKDAAAMRRFLFSKNQDILDSVLHNEVQVTGNLNHVYRFGYLARDLQFRLLGVR